MRRNGDPGQTKPTIDATKVIHINVNPDIPNGWSGEPSGQSPNPGPST
jgi:hypothetical protein